MSDGFKLFDLSAHLPLVVQHAGDPDKRYRGYLLGKVSDSRLLIAGEDLSRFTANDPLILRSVTEGKALGFQSIVREVVKSPIPLCFLEVPANVETVTLRKADRLNVYIPTDVRTTTLSGENVLLLKTMMLNLSSGGCRVFAKRRLPPNTTVFVSFFLPAEKKIIALSGEVLESYQQNEVHGHRVKFHQTEKNLQDLSEVKTWVNQNLLYADLH